MSTYDEDSYSMIFTSLKHPMRRKILRILSSEAQTFSDLQKQFKIESSHLTYHIDSLGNLLYKTDEGKYALSSLGEAAVSMMKNVEEPTGVSTHILSKSIGRMSGWKLLSLILVCGLIASLIFNGLALQRYNDLASTNNKLNTAYSDLTNFYDQLNQSYGELNRTYHELNQTYFSDMPRTLAFQTIEIYRYSETPNYYIVQNESSLMGMWNNLTFYGFFINSSGIYTTPSPPQVNFSENTIIGVFMGASPLAIKIEITEILDVGKYVIVKVEKVYRGDNCLILVPTGFDGITYAKDVVKTEKIDKPILFYTTERTIRCP
jgi:DNA-binding transcriptional ArsR family regulator